LSPEAPCFPESRITEPHEDHPATHRFLELTDDEVIWEADQCYQPRLVLEEAIPLEKRGVIEQTTPVSRIRTPALQQSELWKKQTHYKLAVAAKLRAGGATTEALKLENCHTYFTFAVCGDCGRVARFPNRCDLFYCPQCAGHLQNERVRQVGWWAQLVRQPKHVTLTIRNIPDLTQAHVREMRAMFRKLRRRKFAANWRGGFYRMEVTRRESGWHLHIHALVDSDWIDLSALKSQWRSITNGLGYIVDTRDARPEAYLAKVTRYVVKGSQLAKWDSGTIITFLRAFQGTRTFGVFGSLWGARAEFAEFIASLKTARPKCECGSANVKYYSEASYQLLDLCPTLPQRALPPPQTPEFACENFDRPRWPD
jgi:hypothetical protein